MPSNDGAAHKGYGFILHQVVRKVEESISFFDNHTHLFKEDFQSIIHKLYDWVAYFNIREKAKAHALLQPTQITLDKLVRKIEVALFQEVADPPRLLIKKINTPNAALSLDIVCDIDQVTYSLVKAIISVSRLEGLPIVRIQLHPTALQFKRADSMDNHRPTFISFQAIALVVSQYTTAVETLPKVKACYDEVESIGSQGNKYSPPTIDLEQDTIASMVRAHCGHLEVSNNEQLPAILLVLPIDVTAILNNMTVEFPLDSLTSAAPIMPKEQADSIMALMKFYDHVCKSLCQENLIDLTIISGLLLLLRQHFQFKRHASGQLFYVRAAGIAEIVVNWAFHSPKVVYAALLYELVRRTSLSLSYVKAHYNLGVYFFVLNLVGIDKRKELDHPSLIYVQNRLKKAIKEDHVQLFRALYQTS